MARDSSVHLSSPGSRPAVGSNERKQEDVRGFARLFQDQSGGPMIEFAFVMPLMMVCLTAIFSFGIALHNALILTQATGTGAEYLQTITTTSSDPCADALSAIESAAPTLTPSRITFSLSINGGSTTTGTSCTGLAKTFVQNGSFTVSTSYPCTIVLYGYNLGGCQLAAKATEFTVY